MASSGSEHRPELPLDVALGAAVTRIRHAKGLQAADLTSRAAFAGVTLGQSVISLLENGRRRWNTRYIAVFAVALEVDPLELLLESFPSDVRDVALAHLRGGPSAALLTLSQQIHSRT